MSKRFRIAGLALIALAVVATALTQPQPVAKPGVFLAGVTPPPEVAEILHRACRDCHSDEPRYPWYSYVAPTSVLVWRDIQEGRRHLNLSHWTDYSKTRQARLLSEIANQVQEREMPMKIYLPMHPDARLSDADVSAVFQWTQVERARLLSN